MSAPHAFVSPEPPRHRREVRETVPPTLVTSAEER